MTQLSSADYTILAIVAFYMIRGAINGFMKSLFDMFAGIVAVAAGYFFYSPLASLVYIPGISSETRNVVAAILIFVIVYILMRWTGAALRKGAELTMFGGIDRIFGAVFGIVLGFAFALVIFIVGTVSPKSENFVRWTKQGKIAPHLASISGPLAQKTKELSQQVVNEFLMKLYQWGVPASFIEKINEDPKLMKEMIAQGKDKIPPQQRTQPRSDLYTRMYAVTSNDTLTVQEKAKRLWEIILSVQPKPTENK
ncbi:MAG: CvpA family protein [bacterium]|nr:CvpA family protein [bacterium]